MTYKEALAYLDGAQWFGAEPSLRRMEELLMKLGEPQKKLKFVHIAGTNGKGSCASMLASVLQSAGYKTALYTSPYLYRFSERMRVNGLEIGEDALCRQVEAVRAKAEAMDEHPTEFELMTAAAVLWFVEEGCEIAVMEAGLGGRFDATNALGTCECAVLMNIGLDHTGVLGTTRAQIAAEKAGILKAGAPAVAYEQDNEVLDVFRTRALEVGAQLRIADFGALRSEFDSLEGQVFSYRGEPYAIPLLGRHQLRNAAAVLETVSVLRDRGWKLEQDAVEHGLYAVSWPARFELVHEEPSFIVDGGHNPQCAETVAENLQRYFPAQKRVLLIGVLADKDYAALTEILAPAADAFVCVTPDSERALPAAELGAYLERFGKPVTVCASIPDGVTAAMAEAGADGVVCAVGSLYMAGAVRACFQLY